MKGRSCYGALSKNCFRFTHFHDQNAGKCISDIPLFFFKNVLGRTPQTHYAKKTPVASLLSVQVSSYTFISPSLEISLKSLTVVRIVENFSLE